jgi:hypothetical protein
MALESIERWIRLFERRTRWGAFLRVAGEGLAIFLCVFGAVVLVVKLTTPSLWPNVLWSLAAAVPLTAWAWWWSRGLGWSRRESIAGLDRKLGTGGLLMTLTDRAASGSAPEAVAAEWTERLPQDPARWWSAIPRFWPERFVKVVAGPLAFAVATMLVPLREIPQIQATPNTVARQATSQLEELLKEIEERPVLEEEEERKLAEEVGKLVEETESKPLTHETWEVVDALRERLRVRVEQAEALSALAQQAAASLESGENANGEPLSKEQRDQLEQQLEETLQKLGEKQASGEGKAGKGSAAENVLKRLMKRGNGKPKLSSDPAERKKELEDLKELLKSECEKLGKCRSKCAGGQCAGGQCFGEGECEGKNGQKPGRGGVSRGRGDAELTWGDESDAAGTKFKETVLPPGFNDSPKDEVVRVDLAAPQTEPEVATDRTAARSQDPSSGRATWNRSLSPRHRDVVKKYFDAK